MEPTVIGTPSVTVPGKTGLEKIALSGRALSHVDGTATSSQLLAVSQLPVTPAQVRLRGVPPMGPSPVQLRVKLLIPNESRLFAPVVAVKATTRNQTFCEWFSIPVRAAEPTLNAVEPKAPGSL